MRLFGNDCAHPVRNGSLEENRCGKFNDFTPQALEAIAGMGATHIWYTGVLEHATATDYTAFGIRRDHRALVKGKAGSPYAVKDYYDVDPDLAQDVNRRMEEFEEMVKRTHSAGLNVIIDFVPNHVARQYHSDCRPQGTYDFGAFDDNSVFFKNRNSFYYLPGEELGGTVDWRGDEEEAYHEFPARATGNDRFDSSPTPCDWYETVKLNYGINYRTGEQHFSPIPATWVKMLKILSFWASKGVDGFRCDMAEMVPTAFWDWALTQVKNIYPHLIFIAEVYQPSKYREYIHEGHFDYLYDKEGLYNTLRGIVCGNMPAHALANCWQSVDDIKEHMLSFIENHDEQRVASSFYAGDAACGLPAITLCATMGTAPVMFYMGQELGEKGMENEGFSGEDGRTTIFDYWSLSTLRRWRNGGKYDGGKLTEEEKTLQKYYTKLFHLCRQERALSQGSFFDLTYANLTNDRFDAGKQVAFLRKKDNEIILVIVNFNKIKTALSINVPILALDLNQIEEKEAPYIATDLLTGENHELFLNAQKPVNVEIASLGTLLLKIKL